MVTNQLAIKRFVRANLIPKLYRLSWQTFWGLLLFKVFSSSPPALSKILRYPIDRCSNQPRHQWSSPKPPDLTLSFPFLYLVLFLLVVLLATLSIVDTNWLIVWFSLLFVRDFVSNFLACTDFWILVHDWWGHFNFLGKAQLSMKHFPNTQYEKPQGLCFRPATVHLHVSTFWVSWPVCGTINTNTWDQTHSLR